MLYHVSSISGLSILRPQLSTHGKAYVYAIDNLVTGLLFGAKKDDFDLMIYVDDTDTPVVYECYPNAFWTIYHGRSCSVYEISENGFMRGVTGWDPELVCETEVTVHAEIYVENLYDRLLQEESTGNLILKRYDDDLLYKKKISEHIVDRLIRFDMIEHMEKEDVRGKTYYKNIIRELKAVMDGHLL